LTLLSIALSMLAIFLSGYVSRFVAARLGARS
jgi:hypothetical protein